MKGKVKTAQPKLTIDDLDLFDVPMVGIFRDKRYTAYTLSTLAGIEVKNLDDMDVTVEDYLENPRKGRRNMRMDARVNINDGKERANIEIQRVKNGDELARALYYANGLATDFRRGLKKIPATRNTVIFICDFDPFDNHPYAGLTRMKFTLMSHDDEDRIHTLSDRPYPFAGLTIILYNGAKDWKRNPPRSEEEERIRVYLEDMKKSKPEEMTSEIARNASKEYKEDPAIMDKTKEWIRYNFADQFDQLNEEHEKEIKKLKEESEEREKRLREESEEMAKRLKVSEEREKKFKEESEAREKKLREESEVREKKLKEESEEREKRNLENEKKSFARKLLSSGKLTISEIAEMTGLDEKTIKELAQIK